ncbi:AAA family ATPase [Streptomyces albidoflavus]
MKGDGGDALDGLAEQFGECAAGTGRLALVSGGLAVGKTRLLHAFAQYAREAGALLLLATGSRAGAAFPCGVADQLFRNADLPPEVSERAVRLLAAVPEDGSTGAGPGPVPGTGGGSRPAPDPVPRAEETRTLHALCLELLALARADRPLVVVVDDIQFVDDFTLRLILHLRQRMASAHVMIVLSEWSGAHPAMTPFHAEITRYPHRRMRLRPMDAAAVLGLTPHADEVLRLTNGNPLLVRALVEDDQTLRLDRPGQEQNQDQDQEQDRRPGVVAGPAYAQGVLNCLYRWDPALLAVAQGVAVLGGERPPSVALVAGLVSLPVNTVEQVLDTLASAGVLDGAVFRHPVARSAVLDTLAATGRARLHFAAAGLLYRTGAAPTAVAGQLLAAAHGEPGADRAVPGWPEWAVGVLRSTATQAAARDDVGLVRRSLELALEVSGEPGERDVLRRALARAVWRVDPAAAERWQQPDRAALGRGELAGCEALPVLRQALWRGDMETAGRARAAYEGAGAGAAGDGQDRDPYAEVELLLAYRWFYGAPDAVGGPGGRPPDAAAGAGLPERHLEDPWIRAVRALADGHAGMSAKSALPSAEHILESCRLDETMLEVVLAALLTLVRGDQLRQAGDRTDALLAEAVRRGGPVWQAALGAVRADIALRCGELTAAAGQARAALELLADRSWGVLRGYPLGVLVSARTMLGQHAAAEEAIRLMTPEVLDGAVWGLSCRYARGRHHLATDRVLAAVRDFQSCARLARDGGFGVTELVPWRNGLAEANLRLGRTAVARDLLKQQLGLAQEVSLRTQGVALRLLAATGELVQRPALLRKSVDALQAAGDRMELSRALTDLSVACRGVGELDQARAASWRAAQEAKLCRAAPAPAASPAPRPTASVPGPGVTAYEVVPADGTARAERQAGPDGAGPLLLSDAESRVALLAARGFSNREISQQLFITVSTVEQHLTRVFRKLGVSSRRALPTRLPAPRT